MSGNDDGESFWAWVAGILTGKPAPAPALEDPAERNERIIEAARRRSGPPFYSISSLDARTLTLDPEHLCVWSYLHGDRPAVKRRDNTLPLCAACLVEDPYE